MADSPGWFPVEGNSGERRWWNGTAWEDGAEQGQRIALDRPTVFGERLVFLPDPSWPSPPEGWLPPPLWEPGSGWSEPAGRLWRVAVEDGGVESELDRVEDLARVVEIRTRESEPGAWHLADLDAIPIVWTPPPSWPAVPKGWAPPPGWKAPRSWAPAPAGWNFWQYDPSVFAYRHEALLNDIEQRSSVLISSLTGIASMLDVGDRLLCRAMQLTPLALSPLSTAAQAGLGAVPPQHIVFSTQMAHYELNLAVSNLRTYLLQVAFGIAETDIWCGQLRRELNEAKEHYVLAIEAAAQAVLDVTIASLQSEASRLERSRRRDRQERAAWLSSLVAPLEVDMAERARVLRGIGTSGGGRTDSASTGTADWEAAEELAAMHLRGLGFSDARRTPVGTDGGFDVEGRGIVAQVKYRTHAVGRPDLQRLAGANQHGARMAFYSRAGYARPASEYADQVGIALFTLDAGQGTVEAANYLGERLRT